MKYIFILIIFVIIGCEKKTSWNLTNKSQELIVVESMLTNEMKIQTVRITFPVGNLNDVPMPVHGAMVTFSDGDTLVHLIESSENPGVYQTITNFAGKEGYSYILSINYNNKIYSASAYLSKNSNFKVLRYSKAVNSDLFKIDWVANTYNADIAAMYEIQLDWSFVQGYQDKPPSECRATMYFYTLPTIDASEIFAPEFEKVYFPAGTSIIEKRYVITQQHAEFIRALLFETNWNGGYFDSAPANVPTNLSEGAVGFFSACPAMMATMIVSDH